MCGICGFSGFQDEKLLNSMCDILGHRGPDDSGTYFDDSVSLGHRRLSIIDLDSGKQPIHNEDESVWIVFNGEIYNYSGMRDELEKRGHKFYTDTDTEVIVHSYEEYGISCVERFNGMFAFAIWDSNKKCLFIARDPVGIKPLYYTVLDGKFLFSSEIKALLLCPGFERKVDVESFYHFLSYRYVPEPRTCLLGVSKLLPGHTLVCADGKIVVKKYWSVPSCNLSSCSEKGYVDRFLELFKGSVERRMISDVPLGSFLSGGIDSSSIVAVMSELRDEPVKTFSIGFESSKFEDELKPASFVADYFGTDHHEFFMGPKHFFLLPELVWHLDEPVADPAIIPTHILSLNTRKRVTVALNGEGADECLGGYEQYKIMLLKEKYGSLVPSGLKRRFLPCLVGAAPDAVLDKFFKYSSSLGREGKKRFLEFVSLDDYSRSYLSLVGIFSSDEKRGLCTDKMLDDVKGVDSVDCIRPYFEGVSSPGLVRAMNVLDFNVFLRHLLLKVDKITMAHGLEARVPFLDKELVSFGINLPPAMKIRNYSGKYVLRRAMSGILPSEVLRRKKQRFFVPIDSWFDNELKDVVSGVLSFAHLVKDGYIREDSLLKLFENYRSSPLYYGRQVWSILMLELWYNVFLKQDDVAKPVLDFDKLY